MIFMSMSPGLPGNLKFGPIGPIVITFSTINIILLLGTWNCHLKILWIQGRFRCISLTGWRFSCMCFYNIIVNYRFGCFLQVISHWCCNWLIWLGWLNFHGILQLFLWLLRNGMIEECSDCGTIRTSWDKRANHKLSVLGFGSKAWDAGSLKFIWSCLRSERCRWCLGWKTVWQMNIAS